MARWHVHVVQMRARDIRRGDVVSRDPEHGGWFRVHEALTLPDGTINITDKGNQRSFTMGSYDLVSLQTPVPLPAEADASNRRRRPSRGDVNDADATGTEANGTDADGAAAREAIARDLQPEPGTARGTLPSS